MQPKSFRAIILSVFLLSIIVIPPDDTVARLQRFPARDAVIIPGQSTQVILYISPLLSPNGDLSTNHRLWPITCEVIQ